MSIIQVISVTAAATRGVQSVLRAHSRHLLAHRTAHSVPQPKYLQQHRLDAILVHRAALLMHQRPHARFVGPDTSNLLRLSATANCVRKAPFLILILPPA